MRSMLQGISVFMAVLLVSCGGGSGHQQREQPTSAATVPPVLSISAFYYTDPPAMSDLEWLTRYVGAFQMTLDAGATGQFVSFRWSELEPRRGQYNLSKLEEFRGAMQTAATYNLTQLVGLQIINTVSREVPAELVNTAWDDPAMISALEDLLDQLLPIMAQEVAYLSIGNEVDVYFAGGHSDELDAYQALFANLHDYVQQRSPHIKTGMTITASGWLGSNSQQLLDLNQQADVLITTYYPLNTDFTVQPPTAPAAAFADLVALAGSRSLILQEVGYPSATGNGSSENQQAEFIHQTLSAWRDHQNRIPFLNLFLLHDFSTALVNELVSYYGESDPRFRSYLDSLGLRHRDNTDKPAWQAVLTEMQ